MGGKSPALFPLLLRSGRLPDRLRLWLLLPACVVLVVLIDAYNAAGGCLSQGSWKVFWPTLEAAAWCFFLLSYLALAPRLPRPVSKTLVALGLIGYSTDLVHYPLLHMIVGEQRLVSLDAIPLLGVYTTALVVSLPLILAVAWLSYTAVEKPFLELRRSYPIDS